jgi:hypothetical protein
MVPSVTSRRTSCISGKNRVHIPSMRKSPLSLASPTTLSASAAFKVKGFSQSTALPALRHSSAFSAWKGWGVAT